MSTPVAEVVDRLVPGSRTRTRLTHLEVLSPVRAAVRRGLAWLDPVLVEAWRARGVESPWTAQAEAAQAARRTARGVDRYGIGEVAGLPDAALTSVLAGRRANGRRGSTVLYLSPTRPWRRTSSRACSRSACRTCARPARRGDSSREQQDWARDHEEYLLTNPDMLRRSMLPPARWSKFFRVLDYVVDEYHHYRGVFGAHVAQIIRRLRRVALLYGSHPTFVVASATVAEPGSPPGA